MKNARPIITLTTDFGLTDHYVAAMKAAILRQCPEANLVDVTHQIPPGDILGGSFVFGRVIDAFDPGSVHLAVVDPRVGTDRRLLIADIRGRQIVCPDNGVVTSAWRNCPSPSAAEITWRPPDFSATFHGRDILGPVAGKLAAGADMHSLARSISQPMLLPIDQLIIIHIDHYGNAVTNIPRAAVKPSATVRVGDLLVGPVRRTYADVAGGQKLAIINSSGLLEIAVRDGSAARTLGIKVGDEVLLS
jgi:S-adenosyl-L-methionine hydrolase (adenosine-forming)